MRIKILFKAAFCATVLFLCQHQATDADDLNVTASAADNYTDLVSKISQSRLLSTLTYLTASPRKTYDVQESVIGWLKGIADSTGAATRLHSYEYNGQTWHNLVATLPGEVSSEPSARRLVIGAHIDSVADSPGADDNAAGAAAVLEALRVLDGADMGMRVDFVFFTNEEAGKIGSGHYASDARAAGENIIGMIAVDMIAFGPDDEDLDIVTVPEYSWLARAFLSASTACGILPAKVVVKEKCG